MATKAQKIAYDKYQAKFEKEAKRLVESWFRRNKLGIDRNSLYLVWFAFTNDGYRCMVTSTVYKNNFFEISKNVKTKETICNCFELFECFVKPSNSPLILMHDRTDAYDC